MNFRQMKLEGTCRDHFVQPHCLGRATWSRVPMARWLLNVSKDGDSTTSFGNLCQHLDTFSKKHFMIFRQNMFVPITSSRALFTSFISNVPMYSCESSQTTCPWTSTAWHSAGFPTACFHLLSFMLQYIHKFTKECAFSVIFSASVVPRHWFPVYAWGYLT